MNSSESEQKSLNSNFHKWQTFIYFFFKPTELNVSTVGTLYDNLDS